MDRVAVGHGGGESLQHNDCYAARFQSDVRARVEGAAATVGREDASLGMEIALAVGSGGKELQDSLPPN